MWNGAECNNTPEYSEIPPPKKEVNQLVIVSVQGLPFDVKDSKINSVFVKYGNLKQINKKGNCINIHLERKSSFTGIKTIRINGSTYSCTCNFN